MSIHPTVGSTRGSSIEMQPIDSSNATTQKVNQAAGGRFQPGNAKHINPCRSALGVLQSIFSTPPKASNLTLANLKPTSEDDRREEARLKAEALMAQGKRAAQASKEQRANDQKKVQQ